jgi:hypothetical protein
LFLKIAPKKNCEKKFQEAERLPAGKAGIKTKSVRILLSRKVILF